MVRSAARTSLSCLNHSTRLLFTLMCETPTSPTATSARPASTVMPGAFAPTAASLRSMSALRFTVLFSSDEALPILSSRTKVRMAGIRLKLNSRNARVPNTISPPNTLTGTMCMNSSTAKAAAVASAV